MSRCEAKTRKGNRCRNSAMEGSRFCGVHAEQADRGGTGAPGGASDAADLDEFMEELGEAARTILGIAAVGAALLIALRLGRRC